MVIKVFLADDHRVVLDGLCLILSQQPDLQVVGQSTSGLETVRLVAQTTPDVVVLDITMPDLNGIEAMKRICALSPATRVLILSMHATINLIRRALHAGAAGYLLKGSAGSEVVQAIRTVYTEHRYLSQKVAVLLDNDQLQPSNCTEIRDPLACLSSRERQVLQLVIEGKTSAEIAAILNVSPKSVATYRSRLMQKLGISDLPSLIKFSIQHGLTPLE